MKQRPLDQIEPTPKLFTLKDTIGYQKAWGTHAFLATRPRLFYLVLNLFGRNRTGTITKDTALVISAAAGSGNTFAADVLRAQQPDRHIASHHHRPLEIIQGARCGVPCLVIVRNPIDSISSATSRGAFPYSAEGLEWALKDHTLFYKTLLTVNDGFVAATFTEIVTDLPAVMDRVNRRFDTQFSVPANDSEELRGLVYDNKWREENRYRPKDHVREALLNEYFDELRGDALQTYKAFCARHDLLS